MANAAAFVGVAGRTDIGCACAPVQHHYLCYNLTTQTLQIVGRDEDSFSMDCKELLSFSPQLYRSLVAYPREVIPVLDDVLNNLAAALRRGDAGAAAAGDGGDDGSQIDAQPAADPGMQAINIRPYNLSEPRAIRDLDPNDIEALVQIDGLVTRVSNVMPDLRCASALLSLPAQVFIPGSLSQYSCCASRRKVYQLDHYPKGKTMNMYFSWKESMHIMLQVISKLRLRIVLVPTLVQCMPITCLCLRPGSAFRVAKFTCEKCGHSLWAPNEGGKVSHPTECPHCNAKHMMKLIHNQSLYSDKQLIKIQESPNLIPEGETPHAVTAFVYDALVDFVRPGDRVTVVGMFLLKVEGAC